MGQEMEGTFPKEVPASPGSKRSHPSALVENDEGSRIVPIPGITVSLALALANLYMDNYYLFNI